VAAGFGYRALGRIQHRAGATRADGRARPSGVPAPAPASTTAAGAGG
jgi:hypothetical protein